MNLAPSSGQSVCLSVPRFLRRLALYIFYWTNTLGDISLWQAMTPIIFKIESIKSIYIDNKSIPRYFFDPSEVLDADIKKVSKMGSYGQNSGQ